MSRLSKEFMPCIRDRVTHQTKFDECVTKHHRSTAEYVYGVTQSDVESEDAEQGF
jgi:hypothetical protein